MKTAVIILSLIPVYLLSQAIEFQSPQNIRLFADYLFCEKDYLRAVEEYEKYLVFMDSDTIEFKVALSFAYMNDFKRSLNKFNSIKKSNRFYEESQMEILRCLLITGNDSLFNVSADKLINSNSPYAINSNKLYNVSLLLNSTTMTEKERFLFPYNPEEKNTVNEFYSRKTNPSYKNPVVAGVLSTILPGSGKIYTENYGDGITAFLLTGLFGYLAYTNFDHDHHTRAWIFTVLSAGFYVGNIYGSVASAQIFNARINFEFEEGVKFYLKEQNFFAPAYDFCK